MESLGRLSPEIQLDASPVIELPVKDYKGIAPNDEAYLLMTKYAARAQSSAWIETPDGWFFPMKDLKLEAQDVAKLLLREAAMAGEFQVFGGIQIAVNEVRIPTVSIGSTFRFARDMVDAIIRGSGEGQRIYIDNDRYVLLNLKPDMASIEWRWPVRGRVDIPRSLLRGKLQNAQREIQEFADVLAPFLLEQSLFAIDSSRFRFMFGL